MLKPTSVARPPASLKNRPVYKWCVGEGLPHCKTVLKARTLEGERDQDPLCPELATPARAVASNLNSHFLFYFEILSGISGMLRRAICKALSTECSHWLQAAHMETHHSSGLAFRPWNQALRVQERPAGPRSGWMPARLERRRFKAPCNSVMQRKVSLLNEVKFPGSDG